MAFLLTQIMDKLNALHLIVLLAFLINSGGFLNMHLLILRM